MLTNDVLRSLRYTLKINNAEIVEICQLADCVVGENEIYAYLRNEEEPDFQECPGKVLACFLDGLIYYNRGKDESRSAAPLELPVTNNLVMKKLKVAFALREEDMLEIIQSSGFTFGKAELSAIMRKKGHPNYRECGDQALRNFLKGLTSRIQAE